MNKLSKIARVPINFHMIPYHLQYETRDCVIHSLKSPSPKTIINREKYIRKFNPYLKINVSENLDISLMKFYQSRYIHR